MAYNMKSIKEEFKKKGIFYTPPELANFLLKYVDFKPRDVYDPTCGDGALLSAFEDEVKKYGQEINDDQLLVANERLTNFTGICGDTLKNPAFLGQKFHLIMANPPFSIKWEPQEDERFNKAPVLAPPSKADYAFLLHIIHYMATDGKAIVLNFPGILYRGNREGKIRKWIIEQNLIERVVAIPPKNFVDTAIATVLLVLNKQKTTTDIIFEDVEHNIERTVELEEIKENDFNLSVSMYIDYEEPKEQLDPSELQANRRKHFLAHLKNEIAVDKVICDFENKRNGNFNHIDYLSEIENLVKKAIDYEKEKSDEKNNN